MRVRKLEVQAGTRDNSIWVFLRTRLGRLPYSGGYSRVALHLVLRLSRASR